MRCDISKLRKHNLQTLFALEGHCVLQIERTVSQTYEDQITFQFKESDAT